MPVFILLAFLEWFEILSFVEKEPGRWSNVKDDMNWKCKAWGKVFHERRQGADGEKANKNFIFLG